MTNLCRENVRVARTKLITLGLLWGLGGASTACTPATPDHPGSDGGPGMASGGIAGTGGAAPPGSGGVSGGDSGGATSSGGGSGSGGFSGGDTGGAPASGGATGAGAGGSVGSGGATAGASGGATPVTGGRTGSAGSTASGGSTGTGGAAATGCDWTSTAGRIVLFDGANLDQWKNQKTGGAAQWKVIGDGSMEVVPLEPPTDIQSKMKFDDLCVHLEYMTPTYPANVTGQQRGNSGVFLRSAYEMQILDSFGKPAALDGCGAIYNISPPLVVACNMELVWNTYEIQLQAPVWDAAGKKTENAVLVSATLNGKQVQRNVELNPAGGATQAGQPDDAGPQPLMLQDHRNLVRFRNIWVKVPH